MTVPPAPPSVVSHFEAENIDLKRRSEELQELVSQPEVQPSGAKVFSDHPVNLRSNVKLLALLLATIVGAVIPPLLVVQDRWLGKSFAPARLQQVWCKIGFLCHSAYPSYFALIWVACAGLAALMLAWKADSGRLSDAELAVPSAKHDLMGVGARQSRLSRALLIGSSIGFIAVVVIDVARKSLPGWELIAVILAHLLGWFLREVPLGAVARAWRRNQDRLIGLGLAHIALVACLASYYSAQGFQWLFAILLAVAVLNLLRHSQEISPVFWVISLAIILYTLYIDGWWFSVIGDEYSFFTLGREIVQRHNLSYILAHAFDGASVYETHPYFSSLLQALFMKLLGSNNFGWRFGSLYLSAISIGFLFYFFKAFVAYRTALVASFLLGASHYIMSFGKIGYNNLQALLALAAAMACTAWAVRSRRALAFATLGVALGSCFYVYPAALYALPISILLLLFYYAPTSRAALQRWGVMCLPVIMLVFPLLLQPGYWQAKIPGTLFYNPHVVQTTQSIVEHFGTNLLYALFAFVYAPQESHFVVASLVDPLTTALILLGSVYLLKEAFRRDRFAGFLMTSWAVMLVLVGASHDRAYPPNTRMFLLLPWYCLAAAIGLTWLVERIRQLQLIRVPVRAISSVVIAGVIGLNLYQAYSLSPRRMTGLEQFETLFFRLAGQVQRVASDPPKTYVFLITRNWDIGGLRVLQKVYSLPPSETQLVSVVISEGHLPESARLRIADPDTLVIIQPWMDAAWQSALGSAIGAAGKTPCPIRSTAGQERFILWHDPALNALCH